MAITQAMCSSFKQQILLGEHDLDTDVIKLALYTGAATLSDATTVYTTSNEVVGSGYVAGGNTLTGTTVSLSGTTAFVDFNNTTWNPAAFTARGALIYNSTKSNKAIAVLDFGADKTSQNSFTVQMPENTSTSALLRLG
jgi:O-acetylhomoserine/O-acetylserine sulfhydrylase-like pyridoxal-dependent enzyme